MNKKAIALTSIGLKILSLIITLPINIIAILSIANIAQGHIVLKIISYVLSLLLIFICIICFRCRILIDSEKKQLKIYQLKIIVLSFENIKAFEVNDKNSIHPEKYYNIIVQYKNGHQQILSGYSSLIKKRGKEKTIELVNLLNHTIATYHKQQNL